MKYRIKKQIYLDQLEEYFKLHSAIKEVRISLGCRFYICSNGESEIQTQLERIA